MEDDGLLWAAAAAVVQELMEAEAQAPERQRTILSRLSDTKRNAIIEGSAHVVQEKVGVRPDVPVQQCRRH